MSVEYTKMALVRYLMRESSLYFGKVQELREAVHGWLSYVPQTFPHYTRHTIEHSDEIILQLSKMLFQEEDPRRPTVRLSSVEAYILIAASYLHDAGMVVSDQERTAIITSEAWKSWTTGNGGGANRWRAIDAFRRGAEPADPSLRHFLADIQTRFLIAEFIRRRHHLRAADVLRQHQSALGRFAFSDPQLEEAISSVCIAHGLSIHELEDVQRYPDRRDVRGEPVNIRFLALLLRIGDLLDLSYDRACPLLLNAACPLPYDSLAHWSQYTRITHRLTAPDRIELTAACETQDEHRILQDWCQWIVDEARNAAIMMPKASRHRGWQPPHVAIEQPMRTISIRPSPAATYFPSRWILDLDRDAIMQRLIYDVHEQPIAFLLELLQNALDATRHKMYLDLTRRGTTPPQYPPQVDEDTRRKYPISVTLAITQARNELSGELEAKQMLRIEDHGFGMDRHIIERYFLQIGRSYYASDEYRRSCPFVPVSKFGIGFLSVFAVSDHIVVETYRDDPNHVADPIRVTLTGPRGYLLSERGTRTTSGTSIELTMREAIDKKDLVEAVKHWCRMVEFPISISDDLGSVTTVECETPEQWQYEMPDLTAENARFVIRAFPIESPPIRGHLFVFSHLSDKGERWDLWPWSQYWYPQRHPEASKPAFVGNLYCFHGITELGTSDKFPSGPTAVRIDDRGVRPSQNLSRQRSFLRHESPLESSGNRAIATRWEEVLRQHLASSPMALSDSGWEYKQRLVSDFPLPQFWSSTAGTIRVHYSGEPRLVNLESVIRMSRIRVIMVPRTTLVPSGQQLDLSQSSLPLMKSC